MDKSIILIGGGGHAKVLLDVILSLKWNIIGITETDKSLIGTKISEIPVIGRDDLIKKYSSDEIVLVNGIGWVSQRHKRKEIFINWQKQGYRFAQVIHPSVIIGSNNTISEGTQIMAGAVIQTGCVINSNTIINTSVSIDHDCIIRKHCHLAPGVTLSGSVIVGEGTLIGSGSTIIQNINIGSNCIISAGSVVVKDVKDNKKVKGVPAINFD